MFSNFETDFNNYIIYKYYRGYLKFRLGDIEQANREYLEIVSEIIGNEDFFLKYIKLLNDLLKVQMSHVLRRTSRADVNEYIQFLKELFEEVKNNNKTLALKIGMIYILLVMILTTILWAIYNYFIGYTEKQGFDYGSFIS